MQKGLFLYIQSAMPIFLNWWQWRIRSRKRLTPDIQSFDSDSNSKMFSYFFLNWDGHWIFLWTGINSSTVGIVQLSWNEQCALYDLRISNESSSSFRDFESTPKRTRTFIDNSKVEQCKLNISTKPQNHNHAWVYPCS